MAVPATEASEGGSALKVALATHDELQTAAKRNKEAPCQLAS